MSNTISMVIGSWGSYNECNERALGSKWLDLSDYDSWEDIIEELEKEGFELNGIDEELFVQDIENMPCNSCNWDYVNPKTLFETLKESGVLDSEYKYELMEAYCEVENFETWQQRVNERGDSWDDGLTLYKDMDWEDLGYHIIHEVNCMEVPKWLDGYIDYKKYGEQFQYDEFHAVSAGIVEIWE